MFHRYGFSAVSAVERWGLAAWGRGLVLSSDPLAHPTISEINYQAGRGTLRRQPLSVGSWQWGCRFSASTANLSLGMTRASDPANRTTQPEPNRCPIKLHKARRCPIKLQRYSIPGNFVFPRALLFGLYYGMSYAPVASKGASTKRARLALA